MFETIGTGIPKDFVVLLRRDNGNIQDIRDAGHEAARVNDSLAVVNERTEAFLNVAEEKAGFRRMELADGAGDCGRGHAGCGGDCMTNEEEEE